MDQQKYFPIKDKDITALKNNNCQAENWSTIFVAPGFDAAKVREVVFEGVVKIGALNGEIVDSERYLRKVGIFRAKLKNVTIGDNCLIANVHNELSNLIIGSGVVIENVGKIACTGESSFGNGFEISVLNEAGGRELKITNKTSAQIAYLTVVYRDNKKLIAKLDDIAKDYSQKVTSKKAVLGKNGTISNCNKIINVSIGEAAVIDGALLLKDGTIDSSAQAPTFIGDGVIAQHFIFQAGSKATDSAILSSTILGEGSQVKKQFSSENSVLFANSEGFHSEICSVFAGPFSVTHHKSTLLIAGMISFFNAGSGTNQSNHMYKLGPVHQGLLERGCKSGSFSYLMWPCRVGAFTTIIGKHFTNFDSSNLPFSYIIEKDGKSVILPSMNFFTTGTMRDGYKWQLRDRRSSHKKLDLIIFDVLSPYTLQKVIKGQKILNELKKNASDDQEYVAHNNIRIKRRLLKTGARNYQIIIDKYFGDALFNRIKKENPNKLRQVLKYGKEPDLADAEWIDVSGLLCSQKRIELLISKIINGSVNSYEKMQHELETIYHCYENDVWNWFLINYKKLNGYELYENSDDDLIKFLDKWKASSLKLLNAVSLDSKKEFEGNKRIGFGIDGNVEADFENVRGAFEENNFTKKIRTEIKAVVTEYEEMKKLILTNH